MSETAASLEVCCPSADPNLYEVSVLDANGGTYGDFRASRASSPTALSLMHTRHLAPRCPVTHRLAASQPCPPRSLAAFLFCKPVK